MTNDSLMLASCLAFVPVALVTCGGDVVVDDKPTSGSGGAGASPNGSSVVASSSSVSTGGAPTSTGVATVGPSSSTGPCVRCAEAITYGLNPGPPLCPDSQPLFDAVVQCVCVMNCPYQCGDNACVGEGFADACVSCASDFCSSQIGECANDA